MNEMHFYEPRSGHGLRHDPFKAIVAPRPIGWISTLGANGIPNLAPYSFFNAICDAPPMIAFSFSGRKDSITNVEASGEFVWNMATRELADAMNVSSAPVPPEVDDRRTCYRAQPHRQTAAGRGKSGVARMPSCAGHRTARFERQVDASLARDRAGRRRAYQPQFSSRRPVRYRGGAPDHACRLSRRICRGDPRNDVPHDAAGRIATAISTAAAPRASHAGTRVCLLEGTPRQAEMPQR